MRRSAQPWTGGLKKLRTTEPSLMESGREPSSACRSKGAMNESHARSGRTGARAMALKQWSQLQRRSIQFFDMRSASRPR